MHVEFPFDIPESSESQNWRSVSLAHKTNSSNQSARFFFPLDSLFTPDSYWVLSITAAAFFFSDRVSLDIYLVRSLTRKMSRPSFLFLLSKEKLSATSDMKKIRAYILVFL